MWYNADIKAQRATEMHTPRLDRRPLGTGADSPDIEQLDLSNLDDGAYNPETSTQRDRSFAIEDDRRSKITVVSLKSNRTSRTVQTLPSVLESRKRAEETTKPTKPSAAKAALFKAKKKVSEGLRESSIKRIIACGLTIATFIMMLLGVFLPFWNVYKSEVNGITTGYYGGLWSYCEAVTDADTTCSTYNEADNAHWFRATRFFELMAFFGVTALLVLVLLYMFWLKEVKYEYLQWAIIGLCFGVGLFSLIGLIIFGAGYPTSGHISSAYGITFCGFVCSIITGGVFLWDKLEDTPSKHGKDKKNLTFRGMSGANSSRMRVGSRMSHGASTIAKINEHEGDKSVHALSLRSVPASQRTRLTHLSTGTKDSNIKRTGQLMKKGLKPLPKSKINTPRKF